MGTFLSVPYGDISIRALQAAVGCAAERGLLDARLSIVARWATCCGPSCILLWPGLLNGSQMLDRSGSRAGDPANRRGGMRTNRFDRDRARQMVQS